jgi:hypothetical protein
MSAPAVQRLFFAGTAAGSYNDGFDRQTSGLFFGTGDEFPQPSRSLASTDLAAFTVVIPEPTAVGVIAAGMLGLAMRRRR